MSLNKLSHYCLLVIVVGALYSLGLPGGAVFDDNVNLFSNPSFAIQKWDFDSIYSATFSSNSGFAGRPVSMLSFVANQWAAGLQNLHPYKITNIAIHITNVLLVGLLVERLLRVSEGNGQEGSQKFPELMPVAVAAVWGLNPMQLTSVLYIVQRMASLSTLFVLVSILFYIQSRRAAQNNQLGKVDRNSFIGSWISFVLAMLSKESAIITPLLWLLVEWLLFGFKGAIGGFKLRVKTYYCCIVAIPLVIGVAILSWNPGLIFAGYAFRPFTLEERLLTESRVIWFYAVNLVLPNMSSLGLYHDDFIVSRGLNDPPETVLALFLLFVSFGLLLVLAAKRKLILVVFGVGWYLIGHLLESTILPLELVHEHRNYLPSIGLLLAFVFLANKAIGIARRKTRLMTVVPYLFVAVLTGATGVRAAQWSEPFSWALLEAANHPGSVRANYEAGRYLYAHYVEQKDDIAWGRAKDAFLVAARLGKEWNFNGYLGLFALYGAKGLEPPEEIFNEFRETIRDTPLILFSVSAVGSVLDCQIGNQCALKDGDFFSLLNDLMENKWLFPMVESNVLMLAGSYFQNKIHDYPMAAHYFREAIKVEPGFAEARIALSLNLALGGKISEARQQAEQIMGLPESWRYHNRVVALQNRIDSIVKELPAVEQR